MSDQIRKVTNKFIISGKLAEIESLTKGATKETGIPYIKADFVIQFGESKANSRKIKVYAQEYTINKDTKQKKENKNYQKIFDFFADNNERTVAKLSAKGEDISNACMVKVEGSFDINDYVNSEKELKTGIVLNASFFNSVDAENPYIGQATLEGYIDNIRPENNSDGETGRQLIDLITTSFSGKAIPITLVVPAEVADDVVSTYEKGQTAKFYADYIVNKTEAKPKSGGFGVKRDTEKTFLELTVVGADAPFDEDDEKGISKEVVKSIKQVREETLAEIKAKGYLGKKNTITSSAPRSNFSASAPHTSADSDIPF